jgi:RNA-binding protein
MRLSGKDRRYLRSVGHPLRPVVLIGKEGLTPSVLQSIDAAHRGAELVKVKILELADHDRQEIAASIAASTPSLVVGLVGGTILLYRRDDDDPKIELPSARG